MPWARWKERSKLRARNGRASEQKLLRAKGGEIVAQGYDLSSTAYKELIYEEVEHPGLRWKSWQNCGRIEQGRSAGDPRAAGGDMLR